AYVFPYRSCHHPSLHSFPTRRSSDLGQTCELLSLNEPPGPLSFVMAGRQYSGIGFGRQKLKFVVRALRLAPRVRVAYLAHPNLRSEEHTSELQSRFDLVCRLLLEKKK